MIIISTTAITDSHFSLFGMNTSDSINMIIAVVAVLGFISSIIISVLTLRKNNTISFFEQRYGLIMYLIDVFSNDVTAISDIETYRHNSFKFLSLFTHNKRLEKLLLSVLKYHTENEPLTDYTSRYKKKLLEHGFEEDDNSQAAFYHFMNCLKKYEKYFKLY